MTNEWVLLGFKNQETNPEKCAGLGLRPACVVCEGREAVDSLGSPQQKAQGPEEQQ